MCDPLTVLAGASAFSGLLGASSAQSAGDAQSAAANRASDTNLQIFNTTRADQAPWRQAGQTTLSELMYGLGLGRSPAAGPVGSLGGVGAQSGGTAVGGVSAPMTAQQYYAANPDAWSAAWHTHSDPTGKYIDESSPEYPSILAATIADMQRQGIGVQQQTAAPMTAPSSGPTVADVTSTQGLPPLPTDAAGISPTQLTHTFNASDLNANLAPNYEWTLDQGMRAARNAGNLQTGLISGNTMKGVQDYAQGLAGNAYQQAYSNFNNNQSNIFNRLSSIAGLGQTAGANATTGGSTFAGNIGNAQISAGASQAAGTVGSTNALTGGLTNAASWYTLPQILNGNMLGVKP